MQRRSFDEEVPEKTFKISGLAAILVGLPALACAQLPGEPKAPPAYDAPADAKYRAQLWAPDERVREAQRVLQDRGYYSGPLDGVMSPKTRRAVWTFQKDQKLRPTARLDSPTTAALGFPPAATTPSPVATPSASPPSLGSSAPGGALTSDESQAP